MDYLLWCEAIGAQMEKAHQGILLSPIDTQAGRCCRVSLYCDGQALVRKHHFAVHIGKENPQGGDGVDRGGVVKDTIESYNGIETLI